jgi:uncharacterized protein with PIN domain
MPTELQRNRVRADVGASPESLSAAEIDDFYVRAAADYPASAKAQEEYVRILALEQFQAQAVARVDYTQNDSQRKASQIFAHFGKLIGHRQARLNKILEDEGMGESGARWFTLKGGSPRPEKEFPDA